MDRIIDFIKNFEPALVGLETWDIWIGLGLIVFIFIGVNWLTSFLQPTTSQRIKKILAMIFYSVFIGILVLVVLNALLTERYDKLTLMVFMLILPFLKRLVGSFYKRYDALVDRLANK